jgi:hypothetical protein
VDRRALSHHPGRWIEAKDACDVGSVVPSRTIDHVNGWEGEVIADTVAAAEDDADYLDPSSLYLGGVAPNHR